MTILELFKTELKPKNIIAYNAKPVEVTEMNSELISRIKSVIVDFNCECVELSGYSSIKLDGNWLKYFGFELINEINGNYQKEVTTGNFFKVSFQDNKTICKVVGAQTRIEEFEDESVHHFQNFYNDATMNLVPSI